MYNDINVIEISNQSICILSISKEINRSYANTFLELGCNKPGVYGINCDISCPINCKGNLCNIENGRCFGCEAGWRNTFCDKGKIFFKDNVNTRVNQNIAMFLNVISLLNLIDII